MRNENNSRSRPGKRVVEYEVEVNIRFSEVDAMGVVWHGNYLKFFEDAREGFGAQYGMSYMDTYSTGFFVPIVHTDLQYKRPVRFGETIVVKTRLHWTKAAKIIHTYEIREKETGQICCVGKTEQVFLSKEMELQLFAPDIFENWKNNLPWTEME